MRQPAAHFPKCVRRFGKVNPRLNRQWAGRNLRCGRMPTPPVPGIPVRA